MEPHSSSLRSKEKKMGALIYDAMNEDKKLRMLMPLLSQRENQTYQNHNENFLFGLHERGYSHEMSADEVRALLLDDKKRGKHLLRFCWQLGFLHNRIEKLVGEKIKYESTCIH